MNMTASQNLETPAVAFERTVADTYRRLYGREPSRFEAATGRALWRAWSAAEERGEESPRWEWLGSVTGGGKTSAALALIAHLASTEGRPCVFVVKEVEAINEAAHALHKLVPGASVVAFSSVHNVNASDEKRAEYTAKCSQPLFDSYTAEEARSAQIVITSHRRWLDAMHGKAHRWLLTKSGKPRAFVVDEEPSLDRTYIAQPEDVGALASLLSDVVLDDEARAYGFGEVHPLVPTLRAIQRRMEAIKDPGERRAALSGAALVTDGEADAIAALDDRDIIARVDRRERDPFKGGELIKAHRVTVEFLKAAGEGRCFYSRQATEHDSAFHAYTMALAPIPLCVVLDGSADLSGLLKRCPHVHLTEGIHAADYSAVRLTIVKPPKPYARKLSPSGIYKSASAAREWLEWFLDHVLVPETEEGEECLVYLKRDLLHPMELPAYFDESDGGDLHRIEYRGRIVHFATFGMGRGSSRWKRCRYYFQLGDWYLNRETYLATAASRTGETLTGDDYRRAGSSKNHPLLKLARESHLAVNQKQNAARCALRNIDDEGHAEAASLYFVDPGTERIVERRWDQMFPGAPKPRVMKFTTEKADTGAARVLEELQSTEKRAVVLTELAKRCRIDRSKLTKVLAREDVKDTLRAHGWSRSKVRNGPGRPSDALVRS